MFLAIVLFFFVSCGKGDIEKNEPINRKQTIQYKTVDGVDDNLLSLDIYYKDITGEKTPVIVWVHGGGWCIGDKSNFIENKVSLFRSHDWVFVSVNYRLSPFPFELSNKNRNKFPVHSNDLADAIKWIYTNIEQFGGDKNQLVLLGHSAGAHLVALAGTNKNLLEVRNVPFSVIKGVGVIDTKAYDVLEEVTQGEPQNLYINAFGTEQSENKAASPIGHLKYAVKYPKFFIAKRGSNERIAIADEFIAALKSASISVAQVTANGYSHSDINKAIGKPNETVVTPPLIRFIENCVE